MSSLVPSLSSASCDTAWPHTHSLGRRVSARDDRRGSLTDQKRMEDLAVYSSEVPCGTFSLILPFNLVFSTSFTLQANQACQEQQGVTMASLVTVARLLLMISFFSGMKLGDVEEKVCGQSLVTGS